MAFRNVAIATVFVSLILGALGLVLPQTMATAFGVDLDKTSEALARLACASYVGFGVLAWLGRDVTDAGARRAIAGANAVAWALGAVVTATARASGLGGQQGWLIVAIQLVFTIAWSLVYTRAPVRLENAASPTT